MKTLILCGGAVALLLSFTACTPSYYGEERGYGPYAYGTPAPSIDSGLSRWQVQSLGRSTSIAYQR